MGGAGNGKPGAVRGGRGTWTWDGGGGLGGTQRSGSGDGRAFGWRMCMCGAGNGKRGAVRGGRGMRTWDGSGVHGGAWGSESGRHGTLGGRGGTTWSGSGTSEQLRRGGAVGSVRAGSGCAARGGSMSPAVCGTRPRRGASGASLESSAGPGGPCMVPPGTGGRGKVPQPPWICSIGVRRR